MTDMVQVILEEKTNLKTLVNALTPHDVYTENGDIFVCVHESNDPEEEITRLLNKSLIRAFVE